MSTPALQPLLEYKMEHIFSYVVRLHPPEVIGPVPGGIRVNFYAAGGEISGPRFRGSFRSVGGDWLTIRPDGVGVLDVRATAESHDGALVEVTYTGVSDVGEDGYERFLRNDLPESVDLRIAPRFRTAHPAYQWMNRVQCVGIGEIKPAELQVRYDIYALG